jgi:hypothetical protein
MMWTHDHSSIATDKSACGRRLRDSITPNPEAAIGRLDRQCPRGERSRSRTDGESLELEHLPGRHDGGFHRT